MALSQGPNGHFHMSPALAAAQEADIQLGNAGFSGLASDFITPGGKYYKCV